MGVDKCLEVQVTPFEDLADDTKFHLNLMPSTCLLYGTLLHFMSGFMNYKADALLSQSSSTGGQFFKPGGDVVIANFHKLIDCPDICLTLAKIWLDDVVPRLQGSSSKDIEYCVQRMEDFVTRMYTVLYCEEFRKLDALGSHHSAITDKSSYDHRVKLVNSALRYGQNF